jgi:hypothetical protein
VCGVVWLGLAWLWLGLAWLGLARLCSQKSNFNFFINPGNQDLKKL